MLEELKYKLTTIKNEISAKLIPSNIKNGVTILGITGNYSGTSPTGTINITQNGTVDVTNYASANVNVANDYNAKFDLTIAPTSSPTAKTLVVLPGLNLSNITGFNNYYKNYTALEQAGPLNVASGTTANSMFYGDVKLKVVSLINTGNLTDTAVMFNDCADLESVSLGSLASVGTTNGMFYNCSKLIEAPTLTDTNALINMGAMFYNCSSLTTVGLIKLTNVSNMADAFYGCTALTNDSLNNILSSIASGTNLSSSNKKLSYIGLTSTQATTCTGLSNWSAAQAAGWTTGY